MFNQAIADAVCKRLSTGDESLRAICRDLGVDHSTVLTWARDVPEFANQYARARELGADAEFDGLQDLSDEAPSLDKDGKVDAGWVSWQRQRIDTRKWTLARKAPKKYGDKLDLNHGGSVDLKVSRVELVALEPNRADSAA